MIQYEVLPTIELESEKMVLCTDKLPEVMRLEDPALSVMTDFTQSPPKTIQENAPIDQAFNVMKTHGAHLLFAIDSNNRPIGLITSEDLLGERPIRIQEEHRTPRSKILVNALMTTLQDIPALDIETVNHFKIGNIINTVKSHHCHYALVIKSSGDQQFIRGIFTSSQISQQLQIVI